VFSRSATNRRRIRLPAWSELACALAIVAIGLAGLFPKGGPAIHLLPPAEIESWPAEESETDGTESIAAEHLARADGRRAALPALYDAAPRRSFSTRALVSARRAYRVCAATEHALRDGLGAPLRI
jgi:hypothetical protein